jgi:hypothetical protein
VRRFNLKRDHANAKLDVMNGRRRRTGPQRRHQGGLAERREFLQKRRVRHGHVEHTTPYFTQPRLAAVGLANRCVPGIL